MSSKPIEILYILGSGFSGSTLLGTILGSHESIFNLGEVKSYPDAFRNEETQCTCTKRLNECPFWKTLAKKGDYPYREPPFKVKLSLVLKILLGIAHKQNEINCKEVRTLRKMILDAKHLNPSTQILLDNSKHIWRLIHLLRCQDVRVRVIHLVRGIRGNVSSYLKHGIGFWRGLFLRYLAKNYLIERFLMTNEMNHVTIRYDDLCGYPHRVLNRLGHFLNYEFSSKMLDISDQELHLATGNIGTREQLQSGNLKIKFDDSWKNQLTQFQKAVIDVLEKIGLVP